MKKYSKKGRFMAGEIATLDTFRNNTEIKWADISGQVVKPGIATHDGAVGKDVLNCLQEGTGPTQRIGRKVFIKNLQVTGMWARNPQASANAVYPEHAVFFCIVYDRQPTGAIPLLSDIYRSVDTNGNSQTLGFVHKNLLNDQRFVILKHDYFFVPQLVPGDNESFWDVSKTNGAGEASGNSWAFGASPLQEGKIAPILDFFLPINMETTFNAATPLVGSIATGALWLYTWCQPDLNVNEDQFDNPPLQLTYSFRVRFEDK